MIAFVASVAVVVATGIEKPVPRLAAARLDCVVVTGVLVGSSLVGLVDRWGRALACVAFLVSLQTTFPGCRIPVRGIAPFRMREGKRLDAEVLCVPSADPNWKHVAHVGVLPQQLRDEIAHFFSIFKELEGHEVTVAGWFPREKALAVIEASQCRHRDRRA